jgi:hypothetical protein
MQNTETTNTTVIVTKTEKSTIAAFFLTFLFGPIGLLYATIGGGIFMIIIAVILVPMTVGLGVLVVWPVSMIWGVVAALASKSGEKLPS